MADGLTRRQRDCLIFIQSYIDVHGLPPSFDEIKDGIGLASKSGVHRLIEALDHRGWIGRGDYSKARCLTVLKRWTFDDAPKANMVGVAREIRYLSDRVLTAAHDAKAVMRRAP